MKKSEAQNDPHDPDISFRHFGPRVVRKVRKVRKVRSSSRFAPPIGNHVHHSAIRASAFHLSSFIFHLS
jgi:hypothetical protein